jgi:hypothetical protein
MQVSPDFDSVVERAASVLATTLKDGAQADILRAFRAYLEGEGAGPTNEEIQRFARFAIDEERLRRRYGARPVPSSR